MSLIKLMNAALWALLALRLVPVGTALPGSSGGSAGGSASVERSKVESASPVPALVIGGNFTLNGKTTNLAQYDTNSHTWYTRFEPQLYLYGEAAGEVNDLVVQPANPYDSLYLVGSFDTVCQTCQQLYCSVGFWTGDEFDKVGDGLCPRATDVTMKILTAALTPSGDFFVGGTFQSRVWSGEKFVNIYNVALHDASNDAWLPLQGKSSGGGGLGCNWCTVSVLSLAWNDQDKILYIGGKFNMVDGAYIAPGLAMWTREGGIQAFPGGGLSYQTPEGDDGSTVYDGVATSLVYDGDSRSLYVAGTFQLVNGQPCSSIAVWREERQAWTCLYEEQHSFSLITSLLYTKQMLYVAGMPAENSSWANTASRASNPYPRRQNGGAPAYMIARMSQSPALFSGKYEDWSAGATGGGKEDSAAPTDIAKGGMVFTRLRSAFQRHGMLRGSSRRASVTHPPPKAATVEQAGDTSTISEGGSDSYRFYWEWLPGFGGQPARINKLAGGTGEFSSSIFIAGEFLPPVLVWTDDPKWGASTSTIGEEGDLVGVVTSITQMQLAPPDTAHGQGDKGGTKGDKTGGAAVPSGTISTFTLGVVVVCIILGICLGVAMAFMCHNQEYMNMPCLKRMVEGRNGISLTSLAGAPEVANGVEQEFRLHIENAMESRHLKSDQNLSVVNPSEIVLLKIIGEGSFGRVWSGMWRSSPVAVKEFVFAQAAVAGGSLQRTELIEEIVGEAALMSFLRHPRILHLYGCSLTANAIWIVSELCSRGSLRQVLDDRSQQLTPVQRLRIAVDVAEGMLYLHTRDQPIIHRDLKSHNVFIQETATGELLPKIGDWGSARAVALHTGGMRTMTHGVGTACWLAPEVIRHAKGSWQSDVYAFGILLWELATREEVHSNLSAAQIIARVANDGLRPQVPRACPWRDVMVSCWHEDPEARPPFSEVVQRLTDILERRQGPQISTVVASSASASASAASASGSSISPFRAAHRRSKTPSGTKGGGSGKSGSGGQPGDKPPRDKSGEKAGGETSSAAVIGTSAMPVLSDRPAPRSHAQALEEADGPSSLESPAREGSQRAGGRSRRHKGKRQRHRPEEKGGGH